MGDDEARARATLAEMQLRISQGPYAALGVTEQASAEQVRSAFLQLTKRFHPARFGRMANDIQRQSNEVFLGLKSAHDLLMKALGGGRRAAMQSGGMPVIPSEGSGRIAAARPTTTGSIPALAKPSTTGSIPVQRPPTPQSFARGTDRPSAPAIARTTTPIHQARTTTPPLGTPLPRGATPVQRPAAPSGTRPATPPVRPPAPSGAINPDTLRGTVPQREPAFDERAALREALMQLNDQSWAAAKQTLQNLSAKVPQSKNYRALFAYARGRDAQAAGKLEEAAREYQAALQIDPDLAMAKQALAEVQPRR